MKIYFLSRSLYPFHKTGGGQIRAGQIRYLNEMGYEVIVVMPNFDKDQIETSTELIKIPVKFHKKLETLKQMLGINEDYLDIWVETAFNYLKNKITEKDIIFAASGGELGTIKLGSLLKKYIGCKLVINFHDPINYSLVNGKKINKQPHISREKTEAKYLANTDLVITSSKTYQKVLQVKYPKLTPKINNNYFGYFSKINLNLYKKTRTDKLKIAYVGSMTSTQKPEILYKLYSLFDQNQIEIYFIGNYAKYKPLKNINHKHLVGYLEPEDLFKFMRQNIDIGFVSLANDYFGACVPSKIYEYINLDLPILGALPEGDGKDIINDYGYGIACHYNDYQGLTDAIKQFLDRDFFDTIKSNILKDRDKWFMKNKMKKVDTLLKNLN
jgi:glycosyltransferase involved in cell wall biosynthesis